jgi:glycosyltransferase involved in cell wall biosynthesis
MTNDATAKPALSFIIPVRDDAQRLRRCLRSIVDDAASLATAKLTAPSSGGPTTPAIEIVVVDNGSEDDSAAAARELGARVVSAPKMGVGALRNLGVQQATGDLLAFVDADHALAPGWIASALSLFRDQRVGAGGAPYHSPADGTWVQRIYDGLRSRSVDPVETEWLGSGNLIIRRALFERMHGFDTMLESCEDVDLCKRMRASGAVLMNDARLRSTHYGDPRTLKALFMGELWRGRSNLQVTFRPPVTARELPSAIIPILQLVLSIVALIVLVVPVTVRPMSWMPGRLWIAAALIAFVFALTAVRVVRMLGQISQARQARGSAPATLFQVIAVAGAFDSARALALIAGASHRHRRAADRRTSPQPQIPTPTQASDDRRN